MSKNTYPIRRRIGAVIAIAGVSATAAACGFGGKDYKVSGAAGVIDGASTTVDASVLPESLLQDPKLRKAAVALLRAMQVDMAKAFNTSTAAAVGSKENPKKHKNTDVEVAQDSATSDEVQLALTKNYGDLVTSPDSLFAYFKKDKDGNPDVKRPTAVDYIDLEIDKKGNATTRSDSVYISYDSAHNQLRMSVDNSFTNHDKFDTTFIDPGLDAYSLPQLKSLADKVETYSIEVEADAAGY